MPPPTPSGERLHVYDEASAHMAVAAAKRAAESLRFTPERAMAAAVCASELATNILKYARRGVISCATEDGAPGRTGLRIIAEDRGPGIADVQTAMCDHFSTSGTLGLGLPGVKRMSDDFSINSRPGEGVRVSILLLRTATQIPFSPHREPVAGSRGLETGFLSRAIRGETVCGDSPAVHRDGDTVWLALFDGTGHGRQAADASLAFAGAIPVETHPGRTVSAVLAALHERGKGTVGAATGLLQVDALHGRAVYAGLGNISMHLYGTTRNATATSTDGILGRIWHTPKESHFELTPGDLLILTSDGISLRLVDSDTGVLRHGTPESVSHLLLRRFAGDHDDAACVVARWNP
jgi:anti-sigma regulatory factor (Ser/Thr protein kinase)